MGTALIVTDSRVARALPGWTFLDAGCAAAALALAGDHEESIDMLPVWPAVLRAGSEQLEAAG